MKNVFMAIMMVFMSTSFVFAEEAAKAPAATAVVAAPVADVAAAAPAAELPVADFLSQVFDAVKQFGGLPWMGKIALIVLLLIGSMRVSVLNTLVWSKLGAAKAWVAPLLGLLAGLLSMGKALTLASALAYVGAGAGAVLLYELLALVKATPKLGPLWASAVGLIMKALGPLGNKKV